MKLLRLCHYLHQFRRGRVPGQLVIQMTDRCNARCPQCGMNITRTFKRCRLSLDRLKATIDGAAARGVEAVSFTGGEPLLMLDDLVTMLNYAGAAGIPFIRTGTNGFVFRNPERADFDDRMHRLAATLAASPVRNFWISIDSADSATHDKMRGFEGLITGIARALPIFHAHGLYPSANLGLNRNLGGANSISILPQSPSANQVADYTAAWHRGLDRFFRFVADLGFSIANVCYPMSLAEDDRQDDLQAVYAATAVDAVVSFTAREKGLLFDALAQAIRAHRRRLRIFTPLCSLHALKQQLTRGVKGYACRGGIDFFFVDAVQGHAFPCGYRGHEDLGPYGVADPLAVNGVADCHQCEWECFRDPSELSGPFRELLHQPLALVQRVRQDPLFFRCWWEDLRYYRASDFFDGRRPADEGKLLRFAADSRKTTTLRSDNRKDFKDGAHESLPQLRIERAGQEQPHLLQLR